MNNDEFYRGATVAVTGAAGTVGKDLVRTLLELDVKRVFALDNDEGSLFELSDRLSRESRLEAFLSDVADLETVRYFFFRSRLRLSRRCLQKCPCVRTIAVACSKGKHHRNRECDNSGAGE